MLLNLSVGFSREIADESIGVRCGRTLLRRFAFLTLRVKWKSLGKYLMTSVTSSRLLISSNTFDDYSADPDVAEMIDHF